MTATDVGEATDVADHLAEGVRSLPSDGKGTDATTAVAADATTFGIGGQLVALGDFGQDFFNEEAGMQIAKVVVFKTAIATRLLLWVRRGKHARIDEDSDRHRHLALGDEIVEHRRYAEATVALHKTATVTKHHHIRWLFGFVLGRNIDPPVTRCAGINLRVRPRWHLGHCPLWYTFIHLRIRPKDILIILQSGLGKTDETQRKSGDGEKLHEANPNGNETRHLTPLSQSLRHQQQHLPAQLAGLHALLLALVAIKPRDGFPQLGDANRGADLLVGSLRHPECGVVRRVGSLRHVDCGVVQRVSSLRNPDCGVVLLVGRLGHVDCGVRRRVGNLLYPNRGVVRRVGILPNLNRGVVLLVGSLQNLDCGVRRLVGSLLNPDCGAVGLVKRLGRGKMTS